MRRSSRLTPGDYQRTFLRPRCCFVVELEEAVNVCNPPGICLSQSLPRHAAKSPDTERFRGICGVERLDKLFGPAR